MQAITIARSLYLVPRENLAMHQPSHAIFGNFLMRYRQFFLIVLAFILLSPGYGCGQAQTSEATQVMNLNLPKRYTNPLTLTDPNSGPVVSCPDPAIIKQHVDWYDVWYLYCTGDPLNSSDVNSSGKLNAHLITQFRSYDLINWTYIGDAFSSVPAWANGGTNQMWAPAIKFFNSKYYLYYVLPNTGLSGGGSAIGVATSNSPAGPWTDSGGPVVAPEPAFCCAGSRRAVIDPDVVTDDSGQRYISFGSFFGGISIRTLSADGLTSNPSSEQQLVIDNWAEGGSWVKHDGWYYLFASTNNCCNGPLSGYSVIVGRARSPMGPLLDQNGIALNAFDPGGAIAIAANGNTWVGPGGNVVFQDDSGQPYMLYHAIDKTSPYFAGFPGYTRRPALIDPIDWVNDWPTVRAGRWASDTSQPAPAAQPQEYNTYTPIPAQEYLTGDEITSLSDEFNTTTLSSQWHFIHPLANNSYLLTGGAYQVQSQGPDENSDPTQVSILGEPAPIGDYVVETKVTSSVPFNNSCCYNYAQPALFIYGDDYNSVKTDIIPNYDVRITEFGNQVGPVLQNYPTFGSMNIGPQGPAASWMRIVKRTVNGLEYYSAYTSMDGVNWIRGGTWQHTLGATAQIGIAAENRAGFTMNFDYVRVYHLQTASQNP